MTEREIVKTFSLGRIQANIELASTEKGARWLDARIFRKYWDGQEERESTRYSLEDLRVVKDMHSRKALIADLADAFIALPGGVGTLEEIIEILTWAGLGFHNKPLGVLNVKGFFDPLLALLDQMVREDFIAPEQRAMLLVDQEPSVLLDQFQAQRQGCFHRR